MDLSDRRSVHIGDKVMTWTTPDFKEICLSVEVTAYANSDTQQSAPNQEKK